MKKYVYNLARIVGFIGLVCFGVLGFQNGVKAEVSYQAVSYGSGNITIPDYEGDALLLCFLGVDNQYFVINSATSSDIFSFDTSGYPYVMGSADYFLNPKKGNNSFSVSDNYYEDNCYLITGIDGANPFSVVEGSYYDGYNVGFSNPTILSDLSPTSTNSFLFTVGRGSQNPIWSLSGYSKIRQSQPSNYQSDVSFFRVSDLNAAAYSFSWNTSYWANMKYYEVIFNSPPTNDYVLYYGANPYYQSIYDDVSDIPVVYNVCDTWNATSTYIISLWKSDDYPISLNSKPLYSCSGTTNLNSASTKSLFSDSVRVVILKDGGVLVESNSFIYLSYKPILSPSSFIRHSVPTGFFQVDTSVSAGTSTLMFAYDVCSDEDFSTSTSRFYLKNTDFRGVVESVYFTPNSCRGSGFLYLPYSKSLNLTFPAVISYYRDDNEYLSSDSFIVAFYSQASTPTFEDFASSTQALFPLFDCDNSGNIFVNASCYISNKFLGLVNVFSDNVSKMANWFVGILKNVFPFNFAFQIPEVYRISMITELPADLAWLKLGDGNGNIFMTFPKELVGGSEDLKLAVWGKEVFAPSGSKSEEVFNRIGVLLGYLLQAGFFFAIIRFAEDVLDILKGEHDDHQND